MDDNYAQAAAKHLKDASALLAAARWDGACYLAGYVVECTLKAKLASAGVPNDTHSLRNLKDELNRVAAYGKGVKAISSTMERVLYINGFYAWFPGVRYQAEGCYTEEAANSQSQ